MSRRRANALWIDVAVFVDGGGGCVGCRINRVVLGRRRFVGIGKICRNGRRSDASFRLDVFFRSCVFVLASDDGLGSFDSDASVDVVWLGWSFHGRL